jgi:hypothetical protein
MLMADLRDRQVRFAVRLPSGGLGEDANVFLRVDTPHLGIPVDGPPAAPIAEILRRLPRFERFTPQAPAG